MNPPAIGKAALAPPNGNKDAKDQTKIADEAFPVAKDYKAIVDCLNKPRARGQYSRDHAWTVGAVPILALHPTITYSKVSATREDEVRLHKEVHENCFIGQSIKTIVPVVCSNADRQIPRCADRDPSGGQTLYGVVPLTLRSRELCECEFGNRNSSA